MGWWSRARQLSLPANTDHVLVDYSSRSDALGLELSLQPLSDRAYPDDLATGKPGNYSRGSERHECCFDRMLSVTSFPIPR